MLFRSKSVPETLKAVAKIGYKGAEPWGYSGDVVAWMRIPGKELRRQFDDCGLACCGMHVNTVALTGDKLQRTIELNQILGNRFLIIAEPARRPSRRPPSRPLPRATVGWRRPRPCRPAWVRGLSRPVETCRDLSRPVGTHRDLSMAVDGSRLVSPLMPHTGRTPRQAG